MGFSSLVLYLILLSTTTLAQSDSVEVQSKYGKVRGFTSTYNSVSLTKFLGIPFAKPPTGSRRFLKPQKMDPWLDVLEAKKNGPSCYQTKFFTVDTPGVNYTESEDCLYLNIYIPGTVATVKTNPKAVMFWIYGGAYLYGNADNYPSDSLATTQDVVVVTFNYRLGIFGFMASDDGTIPGNQALFDQHSALTWVKENIAAFGGDASKITIFGQSSGGDSVFHHLMSPMSRNLFARAIVLSPADIAVTSKQKQYKVLQKVFVSICPKPTAKDLLQCLQDLPVEQVIQLQGAYMLQQTADTASFIVVDGEFIVEDSNKLLSEGKFDTSKEVIAGFMTDDGDQTIKMMFRNWIGFIQNGIDMKTANLLAAQSLNFYFIGKDLPNKMIMENLVYQKYLSCYENPLELARGIMNAMTDVTFAVKTFKIAQAVAKHGGKSYVYEFDHLSDYLRAELKPSIRYSSGHGKELTYVFGLQLSRSKTLFTPAETILSSSVMKAFSEFAKKGAPTYITKTNESARWPAFNLTMMNYLRFTTNMTNNSAKPVPDQLRSRLDFWMAVMEGIQDMETCSPYIALPQEKPNKGLKQSASFLIIMILVMFVTTFGISWI